DTTSNSPADMTATVVPHNFDQINTMILQPSCAAFSVCHNAKVASQGNLDLKADPYAALVGVLSDNAKAKSEGKLRVKPCDSANSFLIIKLKLPTNQDLKTGYGAWMPATNPHLDPAIIQAIADWIDRGALRSEPATVTGKTCTIGPDMAAAHD
ncbi:MAG TPA: hypothetical protein VF997_19120, partial [Polyangia bacterium]